jgi:hypothetical protein
MALTICSREVTTNNKLPIDTPEWLQNKIDGIARINFYALTKVYSYKWKEKYLTPEINSGQALNPSTP